MTLVGIAIGGAFVNGMFMDVVILSLLPLIIHQVVGWIIIVGTILSVVMKIVDAVGK